MQSGPVATAMVSHGIGGFGGAATAPQLRQTGRAPAPHLSNARLVTGRIPIVADRPAQPQHFYRECTRKRHDTIGARADADACGARRYGLNDGRRIIQAI